MLKEARLNEAISSRYSDKSRALLLVFRVMFGCELYAQEPVSEAKRAKPNIVLILVDDIESGDPVVSRNWNRRFYAASR